jgi:putative acetyltransferase
MDNSLASQLVFLDPLDQLLFAERYELSPLQAADEAGAVAVIQQSLMSYPDEGTVLASTRRRLPRFLASYQEDGAIYLVLRDRNGSQVIGGVGVRPFAGLDPRERIGEIRELVISPAYRGLGLGRKLMKAGIQKARELGYVRLYLEATSEMRHAQSLFRRIGFRPVEFQQKENTNSRREIFPSYFVLEQAD